MKHNNIFFSDAGDYTQYIFTVITDTEQEGFEALDKCIELAIKVSVGAPGLIWRRLPTVEKYTDYETKIIEWRGTARVLVKK